MSWKISYNHFDNQAVNIYGPSTISNEDFAALKADKGFSFRMTDDDGELMLTGKSLDNDSIDAFGPLDDYGQPAYGCTTIAYRPSGGGSFTAL